MTIGLSGFECALLISLSGMEVREKMSKTQAGVKALKPTEPSESEILL